MAVNRKKMRHGFYFRHFGEQYNIKPGLYFDNTTWDRSHKFRLSNREIIELRDWLSRYINEQILKTIPASIPEMKANARSIERGLQKLESEL